MTEDQPAASRRASALADQYAQLPGWVGGLFPGFSQSLRLGHYRQWVYTSGMKNKASFNLTDECRRLLKEMAQSHGVTQTAIIELAVREKAQREAKNDSHADRSVPPAKS